MMIVQNNKINRRIIIGVTV